jgi:hypothetical protein
MDPKKSKSKRAVAQDIRPQEPILPFGGACAEERFRGLANYIAGKTNENGRTTIAHGSQITGVGQGTRVSSFASSWQGWSHRYRSSYMPC